MAYLSFIPLDLRALEKRSEFLEWLRSLPITFHARLRVYFDWLDFHGAPYTPGEIDSLKTREPAPDATAAQ